MDQRRGRLVEAVATHDRLHNTAPEPELLKWLEERRVPILFRDAERGTPDFGTGAPDGLSFGLYVPLQAAGELIGLLAVHHPDPDVYSEDDLRTVVTFANQAAIAMQNAHAHESEERRARQMATVSEVGRRVVAILGMEQLFAEVVPLIRDAFGYYHVQLFTVDAQNGNLEFGARTSPAIQEQGLGVAHGQGLLGWVAEHGEPLVVKDVRAEPRYRLVEGLDQARSEAVLPLKVEERLVGILDVLNLEADAFGEDDVAVLRTLADQVAVAIENARLYGEEQRRGRNWPRSPRAGQRVASILDLGELFQTRRSTWCARGSATTMSRSSPSSPRREPVEFRATTAPRQSGNAALSSGRSREWWGWVAAHGEPLLVTDVTLDAALFCPTSCCPRPRPSSRSPQRRGAHRGPAGRARQRAWGPGHEDHLALLRTLADQVAVAM